MLASQQQVQICICERPRKDSIQLQMAASVAASIISVVCTNPLDVVKTRMQTDVPRENRFYPQMHDAGVKAPHTSPAKYPTDPPSVKKVFGKTQGTTRPLHAPMFQSGPKPLGVLKTIITDEGIRGLWRGTSAGISHALPSISIYLTCYEQMKAWLDQRMNLHAELIPPIAGGVSRFYAVIITCPLEVVRTRLMASGKSQFQSADGQSLFKNWPPHKTASFDIMRQLVLENGFRSLWKGMVPMLWRDVPFSAIYWSLAEGSRKFLLVSCPWLHRKCFVFTNVLELGSKSRLFSVCPFLNRF
jgi:solute carrier family 25 protein 39/40